MIIKKGFQDGSRSCFVNNPYFMLKLNNKINKKRKLWKKKKYLRNSFDGNRIILVIHVGKDLFSMADMTKETTIRTFNTACAEIYSVLELIRELKLNQKIGL